MELRQLRYFVAVAEAGSISKAAQNIYLTQPALSRQIKALETEIGKCLIEREAHSIKLTTAGEVLLHEGKKLLLRSDALLDKVRNSDSDTLLRVGYAPSLSSQVLSPAIEQFTALHPKVHIQLHDMSSQEILQGLEQGTLDVGVTLQPKQETRLLGWKPLYQVDWAVVMSRSNPLSKLQQLKASQLTGQKLLIYQRQSYPEYWKILAKWLESQQVRIAIMGEFDGIHSLLAAVNANLGIALVANRLDSAKPNEVKLLPLHPSPAPIQVSAGFNLENDNSPVVQTFLARLELESKNLSEP